MPHRLHRPETPKQQNTNIFVMEVFNGNTFLGKKVLKKGTAKKPNSTEINNAKADISAEYGYSMFKTGAKFSDVFKDENGNLFYYKWFDGVGMQKTLLN